MSLIFLSYPTCIYHLKSAKNNQCYKDEDCQDVRGDCGEHVSIGRDYLDQLELTRFCRVTVVLSGTRIAAGWSVSSSKTSKICSS